MKDLVGKVAFITGGASGLGLAMARSFSAAGMKVVVADIEQNALDAVAAEFAAGNADVLTLKVDVTDRDAMEQAADVCEETHGKIHVVCNNAGVAVGGAIDEMSYEDWDWVMGVNLNGVINGVQTFTHRIAAHGEGGHFVNTASMAGHVAIAGLSVYNTSKFAVVGMSEAMRLDLAAKGIGVSVLCPGVVNTNIFDSGRNRPEELTGERDTASMLMSNPGDSAEEHTARIAELVASALDPNVVGDMVLHAIQNDEFYIFTHPHVRQAMDERSAQMNDSLTRWAAYREELGV
ncbi:MAG: SDR family NAD(P)-dependent oxidoreductase [Gammaproteobacteria bacterium]|nr:SDR family NAD(P)-dependent oxidoreductase [Gammaproteobacteria bacterium]